jgi:phosphinothricin acetyltransferase
MRFTCRDATEDDLPRVVEICNLAVASRLCSCDLLPTTVADWRPRLREHTPDHRPFWVAEDASDPARGVIGYLGFFPFMNERPG